MNNEFFNSWFLDPKKERLHDIAESYNIETERYDKEVSSYRDSEGTAIPVLRGQHALMSYNARRLIDKICKENPDLGFSEIRKAIADYNRNHK